MAASSSLNTEFTVAVKPSTDPSGSYLVGTAIEGEIAFKGIPRQEEYSQITVSLIGKAEVYFFIPTSDSEVNRHFRESDTFYNQQMIVWEKGVEGSTSLPMTGEVVTFPFKFSLVPHLSKPLPASMESRDGKIRYTVEAKLIRRDIEAAVAYTRVPVQVKVDINRSDLIVPRAVQNEVEVSRCCSFGGGRLSITASLARSGYCVGGQDHIAIVLRIESANANKLSSITCSLVKRIACYAEGQSAVSDTILATKENSRLPRGGVSFSWNVPPIGVPKTECTLTNCSIVKVHYFIHTLITGRCMSNQKLDLPLVFGNIPFRKEHTLDSLESTHSSYSTIEDYRPTLPASALHYEPPIVPALQSGQPQSHSGQPQSDDTTAEGHYETVSEHQQLLEQ